MTEPFKRLQPDSEASNKKS